MDARRRTRTRTAAVVAAGALVVTGGVLATDLAAAPGAAAATLEPFGSCEELLGWYREAATEQVGPYGLAGGEQVAPLGTPVAEGAAGADAAADAGAARTGEAVGSSSTGTNVQEAGVDEPSPLKVTGPDGRWAVALAGDELVVVDTGAGEVTGRVRLGRPAPGGADAGADDPAGLSLPAPGPTAWFSDLLLVGDRVLVLGSASLPEEGRGPAGPDSPAGTDRVADAVWWPPTTPTTTATTVDLSDPTDPRVVDVVEVEGSYVAARASDGTARLVTTTAPSLRFTDPWQVMQEPDAPDDVRTPRRDGSPSDAALAEAEARNRAVVEAADLAAWLPDLLERDDAGEVTDRRPVACEDVAHPVDGPAGLGTLGVLTLDPSAAAGAVLSDTTAVSADGSYVHATADRLYVATTRGGWLWGWPGAWADGTGRAAEPVRTQLHGFDTSDPGRTAYLGSGEVEGWLLGQWAMDAHDGTLRVGTTLEAPGAADVLPEPSGAPAPPRTTSSVVVLTETDDGLTETGRVDGLGPGEQIRSLRWFDDLAVVVTFEQTDPLYTVDLADPARPRVLGELKVTGYSGYLHPIGDGLLLGVGQEGDAQGVLSGAKVESYDLRDLAAPTDVDRVVWPDSSSPVEQDSRRFAYLPELRTAVVPLDSWAGGTGSSGLVAVAVDPAGGLTESGRWDGERAGYLSALAATGDRVLVTVEGWDVTEPQTEDLPPSPTRTLTVLDARTLEPVADVDLG